MAQQLRICKESDLRSLEGGCIQKVAPGRLPLPPLGVGQERQQHSSKSQTEGKALLQDPGGTSSGTPPPRLRAQPQQNCC
mmetsp:Transcript_21507/g.50080  ORF Transcript_21507/g.50080 Transcript_21507/m.50080 type:complete len:80 (+) Transcript_21507:912-1151(+)